MHALLTSSKPQSEQCSWSIPTVCVVIKNGFVVCRIWRHSSYATAHLKMTTGCDPMAAGRYQSPVPPLSISRLDACGKEG